MTLVEFLLARIADDEARAQTEGAAKRQAIALLTDDGGAPLGLSEETALLALAAGHTSHPDYVWGWETDPAYDD